jgi:hypothetical protein
VITLLKLTPYTAAAVAPSPNHEPRRSESIEGIVLHATADAGNEAGTLNWLRSPKSRVSCHLLVSRTGQATRLVGDRQRAWHAGQAWWRGTTDVNSITLGVEIANRNDGEPYTADQYARVADIVAHYCRQGLGLDDVVSHGAITEERRSDPFGWDWDRFRGLVEDALRAPVSDGRRRVTYDRRSGERIAVDDVSDQSATEVPARVIPTVPVPTIAVPRQQVPAIPSPKSFPALPAPKAPTPPIATTPTQRPSPTISPIQRTPVALPKPFLCSRTLWLNGLAVLAAGSVILGEALDLAYSVGLSLPKEITTWALFGIGLVNILLRFQTRCPIGICGPADRPTPDAKRGPRRSPGHVNGRVAAGAR